ncbi:MAG: CotH kinase family protein [Ruminococcus sp.]|nr:CotH kinase family protein [Ruminococcus sp.]
MKRIARCMALSLGTIMLIGCTANSPSVSEQPAATTQPTTVATEPATQADIPTTLPVLSIETKSTADDVMKFVTEPVARHVAESIASWTPNYKMPPEPYYEECTVTVADSDGETLLAPCDASVKVRGNWTTVYEKKPLRIKFDEKQSLLWLNDGAEQRSWLLLAEYKDASMLRNRAALSMSREILGADGLYAADSELVQVEINGEYYGMYLLTEQQQVSSHRVDITEPEEGYTGTDIGYFLEFDGYYTNEDELHGFPLDLADNAPLAVYGGGTDEVFVQALPKNSSDPVIPVGVSIKSTINSQEQHDFIAGFVNNVYTIMYEAAYNDRAFVFNDSFTDISETTAITPQQAVEQVVDVQSLADMYIISELTCDADIYWSSFFMDADFGEGGNRKLTFEAPWDFDSAMGNKDRCIDGKGYYASNNVPDVNGGVEGGGEYDTMNPWLVVLAHEDWYRDIVKSTWTRAYDSGVFERTYQLIENDKTTLENDFAKNYQKWDNIRHNEAFVNELSSPARRCKTEAEAADFLLEWLRSRVDFLNSELHE